ncbi:MAG: ATP-dependent DNA helicase, partial [Owenweeksia sp.]
LDGRDNLLRSDKRGIAHITLKEIVWAEDRMIEFAAKGRETVPALHPNYRIKQEFLNDQQQKAIYHLLKSKDRVSIVKGGAGVGKTSLLTEVKDAIKEAGKRFMAVAPSAHASRGVLRDKGFQNADTITALLQKPELQKSLKNGVLLVDEAGMVGVRTMNALFKVARNQGARVILSGDTKQHASVEAGDAMRLIEEKAGIKPATVQKIVRQKPQNYKRAIEHLAKGHTLKGFKQLDKMGAVREIEDHKDRHSEIAKAYTNSIQQKRSALIVSPTHSEGRALSDIVREHLKETGEIRGRERVFNTMRNLSFTQSQKQDRASYQEGYIVRFHQNSKGGFKAGAKYEVLPGEQKDKIRVRALDEPQSPVLSLTTDQAKRFEVYRPDQTNLAKGDRLCISANGKTQQQTKLHNQSVYRVEGFTKSGDIRLSNGKTLDKDYRSFRHAYVSTSHAAQGRDAKDIYIAQSAESFPASNEQQFYVSTSRGSERVFIYTDCKKDLKTAITRSAERMSAKEVAHDHYRRQLQKNRIDYHQHLSKAEHGQRQHQPSRPSLPKPGRGIERD